MKNLSHDLLKRELDDLAAFEPNGNPFVSLYLNAQADRHGRDNFEPFVRKELARRAKTFAEGSSELEYFERDAGRIVRYLTDSLEHAANGAVIFACAGAGDYFKTIQLDAPINKNYLHISDRPRVYPLARLIDQNPGYVAVIADTNAARIFVFELGSVKRREKFTSAGKNFAPVGERSQMRYRRRVENQRQIHAGEVIEMLERIVREEAVERIILAGDEVIIPLLRERLPAHLNEKVIDVLRLDIRTPEREILLATIKSLRENNIHTDAEKVRGLFDQYRADGLAVVGLEKTMYALVHGQADELLLSASPDDIRIDRESAAEMSSASRIPAFGTAVKLANEPSGKIIADALISLARKSGAEITFIEERNLLADVGGVGAFLRYRA